MMKMDKRKNSARNVYAILIALTCASLLVAELLPIPAVVATFVVAAGVAKGSLIETHFLGLKTNMNPQRLVFDFWLLCCGVVILGGYFLMLVLS